MARILVIDDDELILSLLVTLLENDGHTVIVASDGEAALKISTEEIPDLVITDMSLPVKTGWEVISELKSNETTQDIPIIALSAYNTPGDRDAGHEAGCNAYVSKPIDSDVLMKNVRDLLG